MPPVTPVYHVPYHKIFVEQEIALNLFILLGGQFDRGRWFRPWPLPSPALATSVNDIRYKRDNLRRYAGRLEDALHLDTAGVPPPDMQLAQFAPKLRVCAGTQHAQTVVNIK